jgi:hypothetical protein
MDLGAVGISKLVVSYLHKLFAGIGRQIALSQPVGERGFDRKPVVHIPV